jgi:hypothetical protein
LPKNTQTFIIAILIALQGLAVLKIGGLQRQVGSVRSEINHLNNRLSSDISAIYSNVDQILRQEASLIESANTEIGAVDAGELLWKPEF